MVEKDLNRILVKSINEIGWAHKISDDAQTFTATSKKPFDYFGVTPHYMIFSESKLVKEGLYSFNFKRIEDHQLRSLEIIKTMSKILEFVNCHSIVNVGFWKPRKFFYVIFLDIEAIFESLADGNISLKKKVLENIIDADMYLEIKKGLVVDIESLSEKIVYDFSQYRI
jgi:penicillin-binding protein-related factor A (putative recombinase)